MYPKDLYEPMKYDLVKHGFEDLKTSEEVEKFMSKEGLSILIVNSVCGCAAANARPAVKNSLNSVNRPKNLGTVFAGVDREAVDMARKYMLPFPASSPSIAIFKDGKLVHMIERHNIEGREMEDITSDIVSVYDKNSF
ncbi:BrxA/BrxB family bacilliredoxin [Ichthyobacterium seriolicida]|uniref:BrxA/BrxB family bacilliredoxin n=1 Tax=Ichthyobacterium seriolicida TaxID=242600 RepID=A0A1J1E9S5_9FLAO|nr:BrxA/BrxB family bacilliredoxin [Ichthyobacterium seriolicida]BAV94667.1 hypothetical protein JBKA6_0654 [Ichthyobacterium seriolicida]